MTEWDGPQVRTAGGHLITPLGRCTARVWIRDFTYVGDLVVLPMCSREVIPGMDFLQADGATINLQRSNVSFSTEQVIKV